MRWVLVLRNAENMPTWCNGSHARLKTGSRKG
jgi:hypothetical protein